MLAVGSTLAALAQTVDFVLVEHAVEFVEVGFVVDFVAAAKFADCCCWDKCSGRQTVEFAGDLRIAATAVVVVVVAVLTVVVVAESMY